MASEDNHSLPGWTHVKLFEALGGGHNWVDGVEARPEGKHRASLEVGDGVTNCLLVIRV